MITDLRLYVPVPLARVAGHICHVFFYTFSRFDTDLVQTIKKKIREELSARHVPEIILPIKDIPYTTSGKKVEVAVKRILAGEHISRRGSLTNPDSLDLYYGILDDNEKQ